MLPSLVRFSGLRQIYTWLVASKVLYTCPIFQELLIICLQLTLASCMTGASSNAGVSVVSENVVCYTSHDWHYKSLTVAIKTARFLVIYRSFLKRYCFGICLGVLIFRDSGRNRGIGIWN